MVIYHKPVKKAPTGGAHKPFRQKKKRHYGRFPADTRVADEGEEEKRVKVRVRGGRYKVRLYRVKFANVFDPREKKFQKVRIVTVEENPANREFKRRQIITKGAVIRTEIGLAKVTSRPGQDGVVNAVLIESQ